MNKNNCMDANQTWMTLENVVPLSQPRNRCSIQVVFYWDQPCLVGWVGWVFSCTVGRAQNNFQTVAGHVDQPNKFEPCDV